MVSKKKLSETYVGGAAGTGKTLLVMAFLRGLDILGRLDEVLLTAPTGSAAAHIGGSTIHAALGVGSFEDGKATSQSLSKIRQRLPHMKILIIDEISMVDSGMLQKVNQKSARVWSVATTSDAMIGGIPPRYMKNKHLRFSNFLFYFVQSNNTSCCPQPGDC
jgi:PIF1-like helicase